LVSLGRAVCVVLFVKAVYLCPFHFYAGVVRLKNPIKEFVGTVVQRINQRSEVTAVKEFVGTIEVTAVFIEWRIRYGRSDAT
jgi:hypothetical protein